MCDRRESAAEPPPGHGGLWLCVPISRRVCLFAPWWGCGRNDPGRGDELEVARSGNPVCPRGDLLRAGTARILSAAAAVAAAALGAGRVVLAPAAVRGAAVGGAAVLERVGAAGQRAGDQARERGLGGGGAPPALLGAR